MWFTYGAALTCILSIPLIIGLANTFRGISEQKAIGLGAVAGGLAEAYVLCGLLLTIILPIAAITFLGKSFARGHGIRSLLSLFFIWWNAVMVGLAGLFVWLFFFQLPRH